MQFSFNREEEHEFAKTRVSFDFDGTLSTKRGQDLYNRLKGTHNIYVITARSSSMSKGVYNITDMLGIPRSKVFFTGSNTRKVDKVKELRIKTHYDNNPNVIDNISSSVGVKFSLDKVRMEAEEQKVLGVLGRYGIMMNEDMEIVFSEEVSDFDEEILLKKEEDILEAIFLEKKINGLFVYYKYDVKDELGPKVISTTRDFCKTMINRNRLYTKEELMKMKNDMKDFNTNVFKYKGGWYRKQGTTESTPDCRHTWKRILTRKKQNLK